MHPKLTSLEQALAIVQRENAKVVEKEGLIPLASTLQYRLVDAFHYTEQEVKGTSEQWGRDMLTHRRWAQWVESDLIERMRKEGPEKHPRQASRQALEEHALRMGPQYRDVPAEAMAFLTGMELVDDGRPAG